MAWLRRGKIVIAGLAMLAGTSACSRPDNAATPSPSSATGITASSSPAAVEIPQVDVPFTKYVLPNGLTLIVHEDHKTPIVAVNVWITLVQKMRNPARRVSRTCLST